MERITVIAIAVTTASLALQGGSVFGASTCGVATPNQYNIPRSLSSLSGLTPRQCEAAVAVETACARLATENQSSALAGDKLKLFNSCAAMVNTARGRLGLPGYAPARDLGLSSSELAQNLDDVDPGSNHSMARSNTDRASGGSAIEGRLARLHLGASGFNVSDSSLLVNGQAYSIAQLKPVLKGGSAGEAGSLGGTGWGGFVSADFSKGSRDATGLEPGFDLNSFSLTLGADYRISENLVLGSALSYGNSDSDLDLGLGDIRDTSFSLSAYGTFYAKDAFYLDSYLSYTKHGFDSTRNIFVPGSGSGALNGSLIGTATADNIGGNQYSAVIGGGYNIQREAVTITPYGKLSYIHLTVDEYSEAESAAGLGLNVKEQTIKSLQTGLGVRVARSISATSGVYVPQISLQWNHEFQNDDRSITARYVNESLFIPAGSSVGTSPTFFTLSGDEPDRNFFNLSAGLAAVFSKGRTGFVSLSTILGLKDVEVYTLSAGLRFEW